MYQSIQKMKEFPETTSVGSMWTVEEEKQLIESLRNDKSIDDIAKEHKRTTGGIKSRINLMAVNMIDKNEQSIDDVCAMFRLSKHELEYRQEKFAAKKEKTEAKKKEKAEAKKKTSTEESKTDETQLDVLKDIRAILLRMEETLFNKN
jgi:hypothetical protein